MLVLWTRMSESSVELHCPYCKKRTATMSIAEFQDYFQWCILRAQTEIDMWCWECDPRQAEDVPDCLLPDHDSVTWRVIADGDVFEFDRSKADVATWLKKHYWLGSGPKAYAIEAVRRLEYSEEVLYAVVPTSMAPF